ncbi:type II toxin-antitoxin system RatA family toxin [Gluconobacter kondonii]|uniref:type II toxin-antitoxin system RatA family toxin n=1 Tax=Gluconobacter kondonii TaxID=941463 RepID=UPI00197FC3AC|nr:type II toxin-antitoxin system RatA family toxin [Gluconobacter kondonii]MBN3866392.1 type II toxin-antitoxin system RatA family toxin [Gluconobacter kondonii]MBS1053938.1 type II toxin-antitoxin system RatA family toxin [Gluconobacter kondonii]MBS1057305.1 type II toxin-antitoxin system RatA family toxin [Gluconobacter kondonii]MBS1066001.1 type II toxin-antitoxin system RatA family toxin [Gluconobacter kondonii]MBS1076635.1 type II toxin-antitoxin system RatA family toxin [Gluconobacter k
MPTHAEQRLIAYTPDQLFDLVADVEKYPQFLPWCVKASIRTQTEQELVADLTIGFGPFRETFTSRVTLERPSRIRVRYEKGPFRYLNNVWTFSPDPRGCLVDFFVDFEFKSRLLQNAMGVVFNEGVRLMVSAFIKRARDIYGTQGAKVAPPTPGLSQRT